MVAGSHATLPSCCRWGQSRSRYGVVGALGGRSSRFTRNKHDANYPAPKDRGFAAAGRVQGPHPRVGRPGPVRHAAQHRHRWERHVYVGDRGNRRVQVVDTDRNFLRQWTVDVAPDFNTRAVNGATPRRGSSQGIGAPNSLCIPPNQNAVMFLGESTWPGRVFKLALDGTVIGVIGKAGRNLKQFSGAHAIPCRPSMKSTSRKARTGACRRSACGRLARRRRAGKGYISKLYASSPCSVRSSPSISCSSRTRTPTTRSVSFRSTIVPTPATAHAIAMPTS
jgi:hypothetical protein